jgi:hypothetical protein
MAFTPVTMVKDGMTAVALSPGDFTQLEWDGWLPQGTDPDFVDPFDSAIALRLADMNSQAFAALLAHFISNLQLVIAPTPPATLPPGTVYINNATT